MSEIHVRQIRAYLEREICPLVEMSGVDPKKPDWESKRLTRALAAFAVHHLAPASPHDAGASVTDGFGDNVLDAIYYAATERHLLLVQAKWRHDGSGSMDVAEAQKLVKGFRDLVNARFDRFNDKVRHLETQIEAAIEDPRTRVVLVATYTGQQPLSAEVRQVFADLLDEVNEPTEVAVLRTLRQINLHGAISRGVLSAPIDVQLVLYDWGQMREWYGAVYGQASAADIARLWEEHYPYILAPNIRLFLGDTEINQGLVETLQEGPERFWYFNNGITALSSNVQKAAIGGDTRDSGTFQCSDLRIVNGAQTAGAIASAYTRFEDQVSRARVPIRIISLDRCPEGFDKEVTRRNNTQNRIESRDFVALDPEQERLRTELQLEGVVYVYKSGDALPENAPGFDLVEATVARACNQADISFAVQAKREIGKLWADIDKAPYRVLFNAGVDGPSLWRQVRLLRLIEQTLALLKAGTRGRRKLLAVHGNRFIAHVVFGQLPAAYLDAAVEISAGVETGIADLTGRAYELTFAELDDRFPDAYPASLFKNLTRCRELKKGIAP